MNFFNELYKYPHKKGYKKIFRNGATKEYFTENHF